MFVHGETRIWLYVVLRVVVCMLCAAHVFRGSLANFSSSSDAFFSMRHSLFSGTGLLNVVVGWGPRSPSGGSKRQCSGFQSFTSLIYNLFYLDSVRYRKCLFPFHFQLATNIEKGEQDYMIL